MSDVGKFWQWFGIGLVAIVIFVIVIVLLTGNLKKVEKDFDRRAVQSSHQYTEGKQSLLMQQAEEWLKLDAEIAESGDKTIINTKRSQQTYLESRMRLEMGRINEDDVPDIVKQILKK